MVVDMCGGSQVDWLEEYGKELPFEYKGDKKVSGHKSPGPLRTTPLKKMEKFCRECGTKFIENKQDICEVCGRERGFTYGKYPLGYEPHKNVVVKRNKIPAGLIGWMG